MNGGAQLLFVLKNPLRYIAVLLGTLYENDGFLGQLGLFGWKDMPIAFISITAPLVLLAAAMLCTAQTDTLGRRRMGWLGAFGLVYAVGACRRGISCRSGCCWCWPRRLCCGGCWPRG